MNNSLDLMANDLTIIISLDNQRYNDNDHYHQT